MSVPDPSRAYDAGVVQVALNTAAEALGTAFTHALRTEGFDTPLVDAIQAAQSFVKDAQHAPIDWHPKDLTPGDRAAGGPLDSASGGG